MRSCTKDITYY